MLEERSNRADDLYDHEVDRKPAGKKDSHTRKEDYQRREEYKVWIKVSHLASVFFEDRINNEAGEHE